ncbi:MAG: F0F1 ATP synthase subunit A [Planctomycetota bacterium]|jgi:F-type H+-transporting ATPase subunit a
MQLSPDDGIWWQWGPITLNTTIVVTWCVMAGLVTAAWWAGRRLRTDANLPRWQHALEALISVIREQIQVVGGAGASAYLPLIGTLFLFIAVANTLSVVPGYQPPTASLSTTTALALIVFVSVPIYGIRSRGVLGYLRLYREPSWLMLPFNIIGEVSRTLALAVRLFGNAMSGVKVVAVFTLVVPLILPTAMQALALFTGLIQAYIFAVLALVYIASATRQEDQS